MRWQDIVISLAQLVGVFSLLPSIMSKDKPALTTSIMSTILASIVATCLLTLNLWFSATTAFAIAASWLILAVQKYKLKK